MNKIKRTLHSIKFPSRIGKLAVNNHLRSETLQLILLLALIGGPSFSFLSTSSFPLQSTFTRCNNEVDTSFDNQGSIHKSYDEHSSIQISTEHPYNSDEKKIELDQIMVSSGRFGFNGTGLEKKDSGLIFNGPYKTLLIKNELYFGFTDIQNADIDGDGLDEFIGVYLDKPRVTTVDASLSSFWTGETDEKTIIYNAHQVRIITYDDAENNYKPINVKLVDNTNLLTQKQAHPFDEQPFVTAIALADVENTGHENYLGLIHHRVDNDNSYVIINVLKWMPEHNTWFTPTNYKPYNRDGVIISRINSYTDNYITADCAWGNFDEEPKKEFIAATTHGYFIWDYDTENCIGYDGWLNQELAVFDAEAFINDYNSVSIAVQVVVGNFDGSYGDYEGFAINTNENLYVGKKTSASGLPDRIYRLITLNHGIKVFNMQLLSIDLNQDGLKEILLFGKSIYGYNNVHLTFGYDPTVSKVVKLLEKDMNFEFSSRYGKTVDIDCDNQEEIVFLTHSSNVIVWKSNMTHSWIYLSQHIPGACNTYLSDNMLLTGNFNGESAIVSYTGDYIQHMYPPLALAAIAAPPTQVGITQAYGNTYSQFGTSRVLDKKEYSYFTTSVGTQLSVDTTALGGIPGASAVVGLAGLTGSKSWSKDLTETTEIISEVKIEQRHASGASFNSILCHQVFYKSYAYEITSHPIFNELVGTLFYVSIPSTPSAFLLPQSEFNSYYEDDLIGSETFKHKIGHPDTYLKREEAALIDDVFISPQMSLSQGDQFDSIEISFSEFLGEGEEKITSSGYAGGFSIFGVDISRSKSISETSGYQTTWGSGLEVEGRIGQINDALEFRNFRYNWGLVIYEQTNPAGNSYLVINYYTDDTVGYYPSSSSTNPQVGITPASLDFTLFLLIMVFLKRRKSRFE